MKRRGIIREKLTRHPKTARKPAHCHEEICNAISGYSFEGYCSGSSAGEKTDIRFLHRTFQWVRPGEVNSGYLKWIGVLDPIKMQFSKLWGLVGLITKFPAIRARGNYTSYGLPHAGDPVKLLQWNQ